MGKISLCLFEYCHHTWLYCVKTQAQHVCWFSKAVVIVW